MVVDQARLLRVGQRYFVFVVAIAAAAESLFQAIAGFLDGRIDLVLLWTVAYFVILLLARVAEKTKIGVEE